MLDMNNYILILFTYIVFIQIIIVLFDVYIYSYLFPNGEITNIDLWRYNEHSIAQINVSAFDVTMMRVVYLCNLAEQCRYGDLDGGNLFLVLVDIFILTYIYFSFKVSIYGM